METTFFLVGGPTRVGKSTVARSLAARLSIGWVSVDVLRDLLKPAGVRFKSNETVEGACAQAEAFFPYARQFAWSSGAFHGSYCLEGVYLLPAQGAALVEEGLLLRACFLGNETMSGDKLREYARGFRPAGPGRRGHLWIEALGEAGREHLAARICELSVFIRCEAEQYGFPYVEMGGGFWEGVEHAVDALAGEFGTSGVE